jgi:uncharacterized protein (TIRG00374 family)
MRKLFNIFFSYIVPVLVVAYILVKVTPQKIVLTLGTVMPLWLVIGFSLYVVNYLFRSLRFQTLIHSKRISLKDIFQVSCFHSLYNYVLPARTGEFSYIYYLKRITATPATEGLSTLLVARVLDLVTAFLFLPVVLFFIRQHISNEHLRLIVIFSGIVFFLCLLLFYFVVSGQRTILFMDRCFRILRITRLHLWQRIRSRLEEFHRSFVMIHRKRVYLRAFVLTLLIWMSVYGHFYFITIALRIDISFWQMVLILMLMIPTRLLPIQGVGNLGTHEVGWTFCFRLFGFSQNEALLVAFNSHIILFVYVVVLGGYAFISTRKKLRREEHAALHR